MPAAAVTFAVSLVLLVGYIMFRMWEEKRSVKMWAHARETADVVVTDLYRGAVMGNIPSHYRIQFIAFLHRMTHEVVVLVVQTLRAAERPLARLSYRMRQQAPKAIGKEPSEFLKTIAPAKTDGAPNSEDKKDSV